MVKVAFCFMLGLLLSFSVPVGATPIVAAPPCPVATLGNYLTLNTDCNVGELGFSNFGFGVLSTAGGAVPISPFAITVTPTFPAPGTQAGLMFSSPGFSVSGNQSVVYSIRYSIDPHPIIIRFEDLLDASSPVAPGVASIITDLCIGVPFAQQTSGFFCPSSPAPLPALNVFHNGITAKLVDTTPLFSPVNFVDVRNTIQLTANGASSEFTSFTNSATYNPHTLLTPEPASFVLIGFGLLTLLGIRRRRVSF